MTDFAESSFVETQTVVTEMVAKAREAAASGTSRRDFFTRTAKLAGATALGAAGAGLIQPLAASAATTSVKSTDTFQDIIDIAVIAERLACTFYINALEAGAKLPNVNNVANQNYFQAALIQEADHRYYLYQLGASTNYDGFYFPDGMFTNETVFFKTASLLEDYFISAYIAAAQEFSGALSSGITTASPFAIGFAVQVAGVECEHRALLRVAASLNPPNNRIVESALLKKVSDAVAPLTPFLTGGTGFSGKYYLPSRSAMDAVAQPYGFSSFPPFTIV